MSNIEWTDATWNPVIGCTPVSPGCLNCYAATMARRLEAMGRPEYAPRDDIRIAEVRGGRAVFTGEVRCLPDRLSDPLHWKKPRMIFVNSMSDLFHEAVPLEFIQSVFRVMNSCPQHTFQVLTKRPERAREISDKVTWTPNVWLGTSVESDEQHARAWELLKCPAALRFLSLEPLIGPVDLDKWELLCKAWSEKKPTIGRYIDWVIVGGESGPHARPCNVEWIRSVVRQCENAGVPCFVKQLGAHVVCRNDQVDDWLDQPNGPCVAYDDSGGVTMQGDLERVYMRDRKGGDPSEWPDDLRVRQMPVIGGGK